MRSAVLFCACAVWFAGGCVTGHNPGQLTPKQQWEALCRRMPERQLSVVVRASYVPGLSRREEVVLRQVASAALLSVVSVKTVTFGSRDDGYESSGVRKASINEGGTGVVISSDGLILTNEHVVRHALATTVVLHDGSEHTVVSIVVHPRLDLAILRIDRAGLQPIKPTSEGSKIGSPVVAVSCESDDSEQNIRTGVITKPRRSLQRELDPTRRKDYGHLIETTIRLEPGFSGGPLLDSRGRLVGINVAVSGCPGTDQQRGYALPLNDVNSRAVARLAEMALSTYAKRTGPHGWGEASH